MQESMTMTTRELQELRELLEVCDDVSQLNDSRADLLATWRGDFEVVRARLNSYYNSKVLPTPISQLIERVDEQLCSLSLALCEIEDKLRASAVSGDCFSLHLAFYLLRELVPDKVQPNRTEVK